MFTWPFTLLDCNLNLNLNFDVLRHFQQYFSYIMATIFSGGGSRSTRREPPTMGKQLVNFITCGCESSAPFFVIYKAGANPRRIGDRLVWVVRSSDLTPQSATRRWSNVGTWLAWLVERRSWHANVRPRWANVSNPTVGLIWLAQCWQNVWFFMVKCVAD